MRSLLLLGVVLVPVRAPAAEILDVGDIQFVGFHSDSPDHFAFVIWRDLTVRTDLFFTDRGWDSASESFVDVSGDTRFIEWSNTVPIPAGTVIRLDTLPLSNAGDQIFVYQEEPTGSDPIIIAGIDFDLHPGWHSGPVTDDHESNLPAVLAGTVGDQGFGEADNGFYNGPRTGLSIGEFQSRVADPANWTFSNSPISGGVPTQNFEPSSGVPEPSTLVLMAAGAGIGLAVRRRRRDNTCERSKETPG